MLERLSPAPHLSLVLRVHDSSKTGKKNPVPPIFSLKCSNKNFTLTQEFLLTIEVGIACYVRQDPLSFDLDDKGCFRLFLQN
jgi:hypothetical protein